MTLNQLKYALMLQRVGNYKMAAKRLGISQPALSIQIQQLEELIGVKLFDRSTSPITPTVDGTEFLSKAEEIIVQAQNLLNFSDELKKSFHGTLHVGIIPTLAPFLIPLFIGPLQTDYPEFKIDFHELITEDIVRGVKGGDLDVGILSTPVQSSGITCMPLFYEKFFLYCSKDNRSEQFNLQDIDHNQLWLLDEGNCFRDQVSNFCDIKSIRSHKNFIYRTNSIDALIKIVDTKGGVTILPELSTLTLNEEQEDRLRSVGGRDKAREIGMVVIPNYDKKRFVDKLRHYILENIPGHMLQWENYEVIDPQIRI